MEIRIYQINAERDIDNKMFASIHSLERDGKNIDSEIYDRVFEGEVVAENLEDVYVKFNMEIPTDYKGRSLSVSDVIEVIDSETIKNGFYFVDRFGFKPIEFDVSKVQVLENKGEGNNKLTVLYIQPRKEPEEIVIDDTLEAMQSLVNGYIEEFMPFEDDVAIICNEEGKINGLKPNRIICDSEGNMIDIVMGSFFIVNAPEDSDNFESLTDDMIEKYKEIFALTENNCL